MDLSDVGTLVLLVVALLGHCVLWVGLVNRLHAFHINRRVVDGLTFLLVVALVTLPLLWLTRLPWIGGSLGSQYPWLDFGSVSDGYWWLCMALAAVATAYHLFLHWHPERTVPVLNIKRQPLVWSGDSPRSLLAPGLPRILGTLPANQTARPEIVEVQLALPDLPSELAGLRIAHLSDLHMSGRLDRRYFAGIVDATNQLAPDIIALTGDIVERTHCLDWLDDPLGRLRASVQRCYVLGNHDRKVDSQAIRDRLNAQGWLEAGRRPTWLALRGASCLIVGNEQPWFPAPPAWDRRSEQSALRLALVHTPDLFGWARREGFDLVLAGHNHGGQIKFPLTGPIVAPSRHGTRYASGLFQQQGTLMHVSPGSGSLAPLRWNCPPNITLLVLYRGDSPGAQQKSRGTTL